MNKEDYSKYYIQGSDHYLIPKDEFVCLLKEIKELQSQLSYLRNGEYLNQLRFENEMLQNVVDTNGVPSEVYDYIECTHRNTELLWKKQQLIDYLKEEIDKYEQSICKILKESDSGWGDIGFYEETRKLSDTYFKMKEILSKIEKSDK